MKLLKSYVWVITLVIGYALCYFIVKYSQAKRKGQSNKDAAKTSLRETALMLFLKAEKRFPKDTQGFVRFDWAAGEFARILPALVSDELLKTFTPEEIAKYLRRQYYRYKDFLDNAKIDNSIKYPPEDDVKTELPPVADTPVEAAPVEAVKTIPEDGKTDTPIQTE
jgi:hypothetical protein